MTPKRKQALQWFADQGEIECKKGRQEAPCTIQMIRLMLDDRQILGSERKGVWYYTVTDKGRRMLHGYAK